MPPQGFVQQIVEVIRGIRFGSVQITIHNARIVQIERTETFRPQQDADLTPGGSQFDKPPFADQTTGGKRPLGVDRNGHASGEPVAAC